METFTTHDGTLTFDREADEFTYQDKAFKINRGMRIYMPKPKFATPAVLDIRCVAHGSTEITMKPREARKFLNAIGFVATSIPNAYWGGEVRPS